MSYLGVYTADITPPLGIDFIGYSRPEGIKNIDEPIYATAFVFGDDTKYSVLISIDNIGMLVEDTTNIRQQIAQALKITIEDITVLYTHTHSVRRL